MDLSVIRGKFISINLKMDLILIPSIYYEVITESCEGQTFSEFFTLANIIESREAALNCFLESTLTDKGSPDETFVTVYMRYLRTGERIELVSLELMSKRVRISKLLKRNFSSTSPKRL